MKTETAPESADQTSTLVDEWTARTMQPSFVLSYLAIAFAILMALAFFVFHSVAGVVSLATAALGIVVSIVPNFLTRIEYRLDESGLEKRPARRQNPKPFKELFRFPELDHIVPMRNGFKYYKKMESAGSLKDFYNRHISDQYSGEVHLETADRRRILSHLAERGVNGARLD